MSDFSAIKDNKNPSSYKLLINGNWVDSKNFTKIEVSSPIDGSLLGNISTANQEDVNKAVIDAYEAQKKWRKVPLYQRVDIITEAAMLLKRNENLFVDLLVAEIGKPQKEARDEIIRTVDLIKYYAEEGRRITGEYLESDAFPNTPNNKKAIVERVPLGIVLAIPPFNYPINETAPKIVSALVTGNAVILKPPSQGSITNLHFAEIFAQAGIPKGVISVITGRGSEIGDMLVSHELISAINFTGSYQTAKNIACKAGVKKLVFGLSGKDASFVLEEADLDLAANEIASGGFGYGGQRCTGIKRVFVVEEKAAEFIEKLLQAVSKKFILGDPRDEKVTLGPVISDGTADYIEELINDAKNQGASLVLGGKRDGRYIEATILDNVTTKMRISWEEPFGPVLPIIRVKDHNEAIELANQSEYGLQSSIFTKDIDLAFKIAEELEVGTIQINGKDARGPDHFPFLGIKHSGLGMVQGAKYLLSEMTRIKTVVLNTHE